MLRKEDCVGCGACVQNCPRQCVQMKYDGEGFSYPDIIQNDCIDCGLCGDVCPAAKKTVTEKTICVYACQTINEDMLLKSSSGGFFGEAAKWVIRENGVVFGAAFDNDLKLKHICVEAPEDLIRLHGSKYIQSDINDTYKQAKEHLESGRYVLYSGTPCQIEGLNCFLGKKYDRLILLSVICHGVPSPALWRDYFHQFGDENNSNVVGVSFREKNYKYKKSSIKYVFEDGKKLSFQSSIDLYYSGFIKSLYLRPSCHNCKYKLYSTSSDIIMGDYWGIENEHPGIFNDKGVSVVITVTLKGKLIFENVKEKFKYIPSSIDKAVKANRCITISISPHKNREIFFDEYKKGKYPVRKLIERYISNYLWDDQSLKFGVFGSYNSRYSVQMQIDASANSRVFHYSNSSIISLLSKPLDVKGQEPDLPNAYRKQAILCDLSKEFTTKLGERVKEINYLVIDFLEERFNLLKYKESIITKSEAFEDWNILYSEEDIITRQEIMQSGNWKEYLISFIGLLKENFSPGQIILNELYLCDKKGTLHEVEPFENSAEIKSINKYLKEIYDFFKENYAGINIVKITDENLLFCDKSHPYGCYPHHLNRAGYFAVADGIYEICHESRV